SSRNRSASSALSVTSQFKSEKAAFRKVRVVLQPRDLQPIHAEEPVRQAARRGQTLTLKYGDIDRCHAGHSLSSGVERTQINCLAECEEIRLEKALAAIGQNPVAKNIEERSLDIAPEIIRLHANEHLDLERDIVWRVNLKIMAGHAIGLDLASQLRFELIR